MLKILAIGLKKAEDKITSLFGSVAKEATVKQNSGVEIGGGVFGTSASKPQLFGFTSGGGTGGIFGTKIDKATKDKEEEELEGLAIEQEMGKKEEADEEADGGEGEGYQSMEGKEYSDDEGEEGEEEEESEEEEGFILDEDTGCSEGAADEDKGAGMGATKQAGEKGMRAEKDTNAKKSGADEQQAEGHVGKIKEYFINLMGLNLSFSRALQQALDNDPLKDISSLFDQYKEYMKQLDSKYPEIKKGTKSEQAVASQSSLPSSSVAPSVPPTVPTKEAVVGKTDSSQQGFGLGTRTEEKGSVLKTNFSSGLGSSTGMLSNSLFGPAKTLTPTTTQPQSQPQSQSQPQESASTNSIFGFKPKTVPSTNSTSLFVPPNPVQATETATKTSATTVNASEPKSLFGSNIPSTTQPKSLFGTNTTTATEGKSLFSSNVGSTTTTNTTTTSIFGANKPTTAPTATPTLSETKPTSLFGSFGSVQKPDQPAASFAASANTTENKPVFGFGSATSSAASEPRPLFGGAKPFGSDVKPLFNTSSTSTSSAVPPSKFSFGGGFTSSASTLPSQPSLFGGAQLPQHSSLVMPQSTAPTAKKQEDQQGDDEEDDPEKKQEKEYNAKMQELASVPGVGEENEDQLFNNRVKLYKFNTDTKAFVDLGIGYFRINVNKSDKKKARLLCRQEGSNKVTMNASVYKKMSAEHKAGTKDTSIVVLSQEDKEPKLAKFTVRTKTVELADELYRTIIDLRDSL
ncbi:Nucleoporin nup61 [Zancudomyces culisetae]|uniref:Nucleoporin nup61 n=1 Tax=Zancudomyces culisetae TaxID=1213189 RepID=A0A1R1PXV3_ZANCU|nr:Nucleoporin nup61 [Zancudomyces culisetae]|eukprot:OMH85814.1 Nucleoporin nup61 [Zancudomyces culisetae]